MESLQTLLEKLKVIIAKDYTSRDLKTAIPAELDEVLAIAKNVAVSEPENAGLQQLQIIFDDVTEFNAKNDYSDPDTNQAVIDWVKKDVEKAFGFYENVERQQLSE